MVARETDFHSNWTCRFKEMYITFMCMPSTVLWTSKPFSFDGWKHILMVYFARLSLEHIYKGTDSIYRRTVIYSVVNLNHVHEYYIIK